MENISSEIKLLEAVNNSAVERDGGFKMMVSSFLMYKIGEFSHLSFP